MKLTGIGDEAATELQGQIQAVQKLGWKHIELRTVEVPGFPKANFHDISDQAFDQAVGVLEANSIGVYCFSSTIMNWSRHLDEPFDITLAEVERAIPRMQRLDARFVRIMSFKPRDEEYRIPSKVMRCVNEVTKRFLDAGLQPIHENCMNYGGMSWQHALELLDRCPGLKWVFDTANPIFNPDRSRAKPWPRQDAWEFWTHIREHVVHLHIKDASWNAARNAADYRWPGEGSGRVRDILKDALQSRYQGAASIEPHMVAVFHEHKQVVDERAKQENFVEYGKALQLMLNDLIAQ